MRPALVLAVVAVLGFAMTSALAQQRARQGRSAVGPPPSVQPYAPYGSGRNDPSFSNRTGIDNERASGRCVVDLGYGRWEYC